jgi:hypothetical protein
VNSLTETISRRVLGRMDSTGDLARLPAAYRNAGRGNVMHRIAGAGILRLALRWPGLSVAVILLMLVARIKAGRRRERDAMAPVSHARG